MDTNRSHLEDRKLRTRGYRQDIDSSTHRILGLLTWLTQIFIQMQQEEKKETQRDTNCRQVINLILSNNIVLFALQIGSYSFNFY